MGSELYVTDEEREYLVRRAKRKRRLMEKKKRRRRRSIIKILLVLAAICAAVFVFTRGNRQKVKAENYVQEELVIENTQELEIKEITEEISEEVLPVYAFASNEDTATIYSENVISSHALLINEDTDTIIASKDAMTRISPASMTKVLTLLVAAEAVSEEDLEDTFVMTQEITDYSYVHDCSNVGFLPGEVITIRDLFYGTILPSGGDAAVGLAVYTAGSHETFVEMMNEKLKELGISESAHFTNCVGLYDEEHYCRLYDIAVIMKAALQNEFCREVLKTRCYTTTPTEQHPEGLTISNWFIRRIEDKETNGEVVGAKTGFVNQSGSCAVSCLEGDDGASYICVTAGSSSSWRCIYDHVEIYTRYVPETEK